MSDTRNRSALAREKGRYLKAFELSAEAVALIEQAADALGSKASDRRRPFTQVEALEWLIRAGSKKLPKKSGNGLDKD